jgi:hypothetical protein
MIKAAITIQEGHFGVKKITDENVTIFGIKVGVS